MENMTFTATKVAKEDDVVLTTHVNTIDKALDAICKDAYKVDEELADKIAWEELFIEINESLDIQCEWIMKFTNDIIYRIDID